MDKQIARHRRALGILSEGAEVREFWEHELRRAPRRSIRIFRADGRPVYGLGEAAATYLILSGQLVQTQTAEGLRRWKVRFSDVGRSERGSVSSRSTAMMPSARSALFC